MNGWNCVTKIMDCRDTVLNRLTERDSENLVTWARTIRLHPRHLVQWNVFVSTVQAGTEAAFGVKAKSSPGVTR